MTQRRRRRRQRGHISIMFAVALLFTSALVFFVIGVGQRYLQKEAVQGAADTATFTATITKTKTFNTITFLNLILSINITIRSR